MGMGQWNCVASLYKLAEAGGRWITGICMHHRHREILRRERGRRRVVNKQNKRAGERDVGTAWNEFEREREGDERRDRE